jgi:hypothetical protein
MTWLINQSAASEKLINNHIEISMKIFNGVENNKYGKRRKLAAKKQKAESEEKKASTIRSENENIWCIY